MGCLAGGRISLFFRTLNEFDFMAHRLFFNLALILPLPFYHVTLKKVVRGGGVEGFSVLSIVSKHNTDLLSQLSNFV